MNWPLTWTAAVGVTDPLSEPLGPRTVGLESAERRKGEDWMTGRSMTALAIAAIMGLAACGGGGGSSSLSEDDFIDEVNDLCAEAGDDLDSIDSPTSVDDVGDFAADTAGVFESLREDLGEISPPEDSAEDFADALDAIDEIVSLLGDLEEASADGDDGEIGSISDDLGGLSEDLTGLAEDLGVDDCIFDDDADDPPATTPEETTAETTAETAAPTTAAAPVTLPPTVPPATAPPATTPPATAPPATAAPETAPPDSGPLFEIVDLTTVFNDPFDFVMVDTGMDTALPFIEAVAAIPILNIGIDEMGVAALIDSFGDSIGTLVVGISLEGFGMPEEWKTIICPPGVSSIQGTPAGYTGVYCPGLPGSGLIEVFTITEGDIGVTVATTDAFYSVLDVVDSFLLANF
jgi:hypothetical protein